VAVTGDIEGLTEAWQAQADYIKELEAEAERLRASLVKIAEYECDCYECCNSAQQIAQAALSADNADAR
jgi:hypothetical protein